MVLIFILLQVNLQATTQKGDFFLYFACGINDMKSFLFLDVLAPLVFCANLIATLHFTAVASRLYPSGVQRWLSRKASLYLWVFFAAWSPTMVSNTARWYTGSTLPWGTVWQSAAMGLFALQGAGNCAAFIINERSYLDGMIRTMASSVKGSTQGLADPLMADARAQSPLRGSGGSGRGSGSGDEDQSSVRAGEWAPTKCSS
jgi:hypothetical protein